MLIGIDGNEANIAKRVGVNKYAFEILWGLYRLRTHKLGKHRLIVYLKNKPLPDMPPENQYLKYKVLKGGGMWILTKLTSHLIFSKQKPDVFFSPSHYVPFLVCIPKVCSIMDLGYLEFSGQFKRYDFWQLKFWTAMSIFVSKYIIAISNTTKIDIVRHYSFASNKVRVSALAYDKAIFNPNISQDNVRRIKNKYSIVNDYVLFLSTLKPSKNIEGIIKAFAKVLHNTKNKLQLVIAGKKGWMYESIFEVVKKHHLEEKVVFTDFLDEKDKPELLKGATVFVSPSFWEGFGLHVLEALAVGTPVVVSDKGSLLEVVGDAGIIVDPYKIESIAEGMTKVLSLNKVKYNELSRKCLTQAQKFDWDITAQQTLAVLLSTHV